MPTQQELLAQFRCDEISAAALAEFNEQARPQRKPVESGKVVDGLGEMMRAWRSGALSEYYHLLAESLLTLPGKLVMTVTRRGTTKVSTSASVPT